MTDPSTPLAVHIVAVPETAGSALYGMLDVLSVAGTVWQELTRIGGGRALFDVRIVSTRRTGFTCGHRVPVQPDLAVADDPAPAIVILPELWLGPDETLHGRYPTVTDWVKRRYAAGAAVYSACSGALLLAETGLLDGCPATSHWAYAELFERQYPAIDFRPEPNLVFADADGRLVTAGGTTSWHDLALHLIARYGSPEEARRIAQVYLLKWHGEGQLPYRPLVHPPAPDDAVIRACQEWLGLHFHEPRVLTGVIDYSGLNPRTLKRRFKRATGTTLIDTIQDLRIEAAKRRLETERTAVDEISAAVGYEDASFFRRLFRRRTGLAPRDYRRLFQPLPTLRRATERACVPPGIARSAAGDVPTTLRSTAADSAAPE